LIDSRSASVIFEPSSQDARIAVLSAFTFNFVRFVMLSFELLNVVVPGAWSIHIASQGVENRGSRAYVLSRNQDSRDTKYLGLTCRHVLQGEAQDSDDE
jgi:hypothetical protein